MQLVTFGKPMAPHGVGDTRLVSDDVAKRLEGEGLLSASETFPARPVRAPPKPARPTGVPDKRTAR